MFAQELCARLQFFQNDAKKAGIFENRWKNSSGILVCGLNNKVEDGGVASAGEPDATGMDGHLCVRHKASSVSS